MDWAPLECGAFLLGVVGDLSPVPSPEERGVLVWGFR